MSQFYLVAPSGYCINQQAAASGVERLQQAGHEVAHQQVIPRRQQRFAGTEHERLADINQLAQLPGRNRIVLAVRGSLAPVACCRIIDWQGLVARQQRDPLLILRPQRFHRYPVGPAGHGQRHHLQRANARRQLRRGDLDPFTEHHFWQALRQPEFTLEWPGEGPNCRVEGTLWGNLAMLTSLIGTPWLPAIRDGILGGGGYQRAPVPRRAHAASAVAQWRAGGAKAVIFGSFTGSAPNDYDAGYDLPQVFDYLRQQLPCR